MILRPAFFSLHINRPLCLHICVLDYLCVHLFFCLRARMFLCSSVCVFVCFCVPLAFCLCTCVLVSMADRFLCDWEIILLDQKQTKKNRVYAFKILLHYNYLLVLIILSQPLSLYLNGAAIKSSRLAWCNFCGFLGSKISVWLLCVQELDSVAVVLRQPSNFNHKSYFFSTVF